MTSVAVLDDYQHYARDQVDWTALAGRADLSFFHEHIVDPHQLARTLAPFDIVVCMRERTPITGDLLAALPRLRLVVTTGAANASIDVDAATARGVTVSATRSQRYNIEQLAEFTWALVLAAAKGIPDEAASVRSGGWQRGLGTGLSGQRLGIVGMGQIGAAVARIGQAFGMQVCAWSENLTAERAALVGVCAVGKAQLFQESDVVSLHLRLSARTMGVVAAPELAAMRPSAILVNTARGPLVEEVSLVRALRERRIRGAALDVFDTEPLPADHPFRTLPNVIATPHIGYATEEMYRVFYHDIIEDIDQFLQGDPVRVIR